MVRGENEHTRCIKYFIISISLNLFADNELFNEIQTL